MQSQSARARAVVLLRRPVGIPSPELGADFGLVESEAPQAAPENGLLVKVSYFSVDPYLRNSLKDTFNLNEPVRGFVSGKILKSNLPDWKEGDLFGGNLPFVSLQTVSTKDVKTFRNLTSYISEEELSLGIGILGMPGSTAYAGIDLLDLKETDRVWVSAATGAVGSLAAQIAKKVKKSQLVIGSAGSAEKCRVAKEEFAVDSCFNYKEAKNVEELTALVKKHSPEGIDCYFENVGGDHFKAAMTLLREKGRVSVCGAISKYNESDPASFMEQVNFINLIYKQQRVEGFLCHDWLFGKRGNFLKEMSDWYRQGMITNRETVYEGVEKWPAAFNALFQQGGENLGKIVVKINE